MYNFRAYNNLATSGINILERPKVNLPSPSGSSFLSSLTQVARRELTAIQTTTVTDEPTIATLTLRKDIKLPVPNLIQGKNECGPTSLAMIMKYYGTDPGNYHEMFKSDTVGHGPLALKEKAVAKNMLVRQENYGSLEDLAALVDKGIPPMVLGIWGGGSNSSLSSYIDNASRAHWMTVTGYKKDDLGKITHIYFNDPNRSTTQCWTASDFMNKFWNSNVIPNGHRYYMAMAKRGTFQESALRTHLPTDKISDTFAATLRVIDGLEDAFYKAEEIGNEVAGWFSGLFS